MYTHTHVHACIHTYYVIHDYVYCILMHYVILTLPPYIHDYVCMVEVQPPLADASFANEEVVYLAGFVDVDLEEAASISEAEFPGFLPLPLQHGQVAQQSLRVQSATHTQLHSGSTYCRACRI